jgi:hypothetical protein
VKRHARLLLAALLIVTVTGCTITWEGGERTGPAHQTGCPGKYTYYPPSGAPLYEGMPAPVGDPDASLFSVICAESP